MFIKKFGMNKIKVLILSRYDTLGASSRVRIYQYLPFLINDFDFVISSFFSNDMLQNLYMGNNRNYFSLFVRYVKRIFVLLNLSSYDIIWIEKEVFPYLPGFMDTFLLPKNKRIILDYDDAIFHNYDKKNNFLLRFLFNNKLKNIISCSSDIFVGNSYLRNYVGRWNNNVSFLFSVVDENKYLPIKSNSSSIFTIGWIGSPSTSKYLNDIIPFLNILSSEYKIRLITIGTKENFNSSFEVLQYSWSLETEVELINMFDVGIMPLLDDVWERGKCGFKLIQYMACGIPVIASPVGINSEIVSSDVGFLAISEKDWVQSFAKLISSDSLRTQMGIKARQRIENSFSFYKNVDFIRNKLLDK
jgi:glycosyltransferase involved in cell wall biosynthesis